MIPYLLRCRGFAIDDYSFTLGRLGSGASSAFAQLGYNLNRLRLICLTDSGIESFPETICRKLPNDFVQVGKLSEQIIAR